jgi:hypothetical protein
MRDSGCLMRDAGLGTRGGRRRVSIEGQKPQRHKDHEEEMKLTFVCYVLLVVKYRRSVH